MHEKSKNKAISAGLLRYKKAVSFVENFSNTSGKKDPAFFIERAKYFLGLIGRPEKGPRGKDFKYIHITGTAGKGTVSTMVHGALTAAGKKAGLYTSPYVTAAIEKIKVGDKYISPEDFTRIVASLKPAIRKARAEGPFGGPSAFELCLAIALIYFKKKKCEWVVLEVGLGGRYDATNFIEKPKITAITTIDYDHTEVLGKTLEKIAYDKAGIIKPGSLFFTAEQRPKLLILFRKICREQGAAYHHIGKQGDYQEYNKMLARRIAEAVGVSNRAIAAGIKNTRLPCRFEIIDIKPLIILDGAHNRAKINSTIGNLKKVRAGRWLKGLEEFKKLIIIVAISDTKKDNRAILEPLTAIADFIIVTSLSGADRKSVHPEALIPYIQNALRKKWKGKKKKHESPVEIIMDPWQALAAAQKLAQKNDCILAAGSFFLAGELRKHWFSEEWVLRLRRSFKF